ncbi:Cyclic di-GMP phosphodiesterase Gmr [Thalassocella blandensis]|nr:Cyclic di-GMP phosphodiesterase Gmr [Thalassocella blandensis]
MKIKSLHVKVSLSLAAAALFVVLLSSQFFYQRSYENSFAESERSIQQLLQTVSTTAAIAAYVGNKQLAQDVISGLIKNDIVVGAKIAMSQGTVTQEGNIPDDVDAQLISLDLVGPFDETEIVGQLVVKPSLPLIAQRARDSAMATTVGLAAQAALLILFVLVMVYWMMTRPLTSLSGRLHAITPGDGNLLHESDLRRADEIGLLAADINTLLVTVEKKLEEERELRHRVEILEHRFRGIFEDSSAGIFLVRENGTLITANPSFFKIANLEENIVDNIDDANIVERVFSDTKQAYSLVKLALVTKRPCSADLQIIAEDKPGLRWVHCIFSPAGSEKTPMSVEGVMYDVTERKLSEQRTRELAETDSLTGLSNRQALENELRRIIGRPDLASKGFIVMMIDLDGFKYINDTYGHDAGDKTLIIIAERLRNLVRQADIVARMGGDEFLIVLNSTQNLDMAERIANKILEEQREPIEVQYGVFEHVGMSIGMAIYPEHGDNEVSIRKHADQAMYAVKHSGKNGFALYNPDGFTRDAVSNHSG